MHIGIAETSAAGPGDCHIKGGYIEGAPTWTVKLANVSFYKNVEKGLPAGSGVFVVCDAANGAPKAVLHENRYLTDMRTGAGGGCGGEASGGEGAKSVAFIGTGVIAEAMARSAATVYGFEEAYSRDSRHGQELGVLRQDGRRARLLLHHLRHRGGCRAQRRRHLHPDPRW